MKGGCRCSNIAAAKDVLSGVASRIHINEKKKKDHHHHHGFVKEYEFSMRNTRSCINDPARPSHHLRRLLFLWPKLSAFCIKRPLASDDDDDDYSIHSTQTHSLQEESVDTKAEAFIISCDCNDRCLFSKNTRRCLQGAFDDSILPPCSLLWFKLIVLINSAHSKDFSLE
eukprot:Gb_06725 [translate_table: standard]